MEKISVKKVLTQKKKGVNIIEGQARKKVKQNQNKKTFKKCKKSVDNFRHAW